MLGKFAQDALDNVWVYDGKQLLSATNPQDTVQRGEVLPRRGGPRPVLDALAWARARADLEDVYLIAFPVLPVEGR